MTGPQDFSDVGNNVPVPPVSCCPKTCCPTSEQSASSQTADQMEKSRRAECIQRQAYYQSGCEDKILETVHGAGLAVIITGIVFCFLEVGAAFDLLNKNIHE